LESGSEGIPLHGVSERRRAIYNKEKAIVAFAKLFHDEQKQNDMFLLEYSKLM